MGVGVGMGGVGSRERRGGGAAVHSLPTGVYDPVPSFTAPLISKGLISQA